MRKDFTIGVLLYGDYTDLARRCLDSIIEHVNPDDVMSLRIGMNNVCTATKLYVKELIARCPHWTIRVCDNIGLPPHKYPMMREMLSTKIEAADTPYVAWFDDDSYIAHTKIDVVDEWRTLLNDADMAGSIYTIRLSDNQSKWVEAQPWYAGKKLHANHCVAFCTGGWWIAKSEILRRHDYPWPELNHRGGDVMLGEMCRQQGYQLRSIHHPKTALSGVMKINASDDGVESASPRRGYDEPPIGANYSAGSHA